MNFFVHNITKIRKDSVMKISVLCVGKIKEKYFTAGIAEYEKSLSRYCKLEIIEVTDEKTLYQASENEEKMIKAKEGERLSKYIKDDSYVIALAIEGKQLDSVEFSKKIEQLELMG